MYGCRFPFCTLPHWGRPVFIAPVRKSRYTFELLEKCGDFTLSVPAEVNDFIEQLKLCGSRSGRDCDKYAAAGLELNPSKEIEVPVIKGCGAYFECRTIYTQEKQIAKTLAFLQESKPVLIVMAGDAKVDNKKYKEAFGQKAQMVPFHTVEEHTGHAPGGVCPFCVKEGVKVYLDASLKRFERVYPAAGSSNSAVNLSLAELERYSGSAGWVDVAKDWL